MNERVKALREYRVKYQHGDQVVYLGNIALINRYGKDTTKLGIVRSKLMAKRYKTAEDAIRDAYSVGLPIGELQAEAA